VSAPDAAFQLDRARVRASFARASAGYEAAARLQVRVADELLARLGEFRFAPRVVLDLGAGTGRVTRELKRRYPRSQVVALDIAEAMLREARRHLRPWRRFARVCADALRLPLKDGSVDLVFSSLMLQWCQPLDAALAEVRRVLQPGGFDGYNHVNHFPEVQEVGDALLRAGLTEPVLDVDRLELAYPDVLALMRDLKAIGAHNVTAGRPRGLAGRVRLERVAAAYERERRASGLPATWEVIYGASWGAAGRQAVSAPSGIAHIAPGSIRRSRR
jgi:malonyl-CoA O-methyltransferase